ncbi:MAG: phosphatase PAP2 family protein [Roseiflexaceae bacterium]|nr:phosphatase PAP2 family protein [Roseiflexaceae bacterium]
MQPPEPIRPTPESANQPAENLSSPLGMQPSPEAKKAAEPAKEAVQAALQAIKTPAQADQNADAAITAAAGTTEQQVREQTNSVPLSETSVPADAEQTPAVIIDAARQVASSSGEAREALEQAFQEATNPEQQGDVAATEREPLDLLREAFIKRMNPYQALDARLFLAINHLPHTKWTNRCMFAVTTIMTGGFGWLLGLLLGAVLEKRRARRALLQIVPPLWFATIMVEYPIKYFFRRSRPFADIVQAIAIGKKPGSYSFPSGHSAAAFAGAWLLRRHYPKFTALWYAIAGLVGFSRIYLGAHYPSDVVIGGLAGTVIAEATRQVINEGEEIA